jgi:hypothetical protein
MARNDGIRYGAGGAGMIQEIQEISPVNPDPSPRQPLASRGRPKKKEEAQMLEETVRNSLPSDSEPMEEE